MKIMCTTNECPNQNVEIDVPDDTDRVVCGPCGATLYERESD